MIVLENGNKHLQAHQLNQGTMKILFISKDSMEVPTLTSEITKYLPDACVRHASNVQGALKELQSSSVFDAIILDNSISREDCAIMTDVAKRQRQSIRTIFLLDAVAREVPKNLINLGIDRFVPKRAGYGAILSEALPRLQSQPQPQQQPVNNTEQPAPPAARKIRLLCAGDFDSFKMAFSTIPYLSLEPITLTPDGTLNLPEAGVSVGDLIVMDSALTGSRTIPAIKNVISKAPGVPVILLSEPGDEDIAVQGLRAGASDCIAKIGNYFQKLISVIEREIRIRKLIREKDILKSREMRLRQIVESMPAGVAQIAPDGTFLAVNQTGLNMLGAASLEQITGKNLLQMAMPEERKKISSFLANIGKWSNASVQFNWNRLDGSASTIELQGIPIRRDPGSAACALATIHSVSGAGAQPEAPQRSEELEQALASTRADLARISETLNAERSQRALQFEELQRKLEAAEEQRKALETSLREVQTKNAEAVKTYDSDRILRETAQMQMAEKLKAAETSRASLEAKLLEKETQLAHLAQQVSEHSTELAQEEQFRANLERQLLSSEQERNVLLQTLQKENSERRQQIEKLLSERVGLEKLRTELEQRCRMAEEQKQSLQAILQKEESDKTQQTVVYKAEREQWESRRRQLEQQLKDIEARVSQLTAQQIQIQQTEADAASLQAALLESRSRLAELNEKYRIERAIQEEALQESNKKVAEIEKRRIFLQAELEEAQACIAQLRDRQSSDLTQKDAAFKELESRFQTAEKQRADLQVALEEAQSRIAQLMDKQNSDLAQKDMARKELESSFQTSEKQRADLQAALEEAHARIAQLMNNQNSDLTQKDSLYKELEAKFKSAEEQRYELQSTLDSTESNLSQLNEKYRTEVSQLEFAQKKSEQRCQTAEKQRDSLQQELRKAEIRIKELSEKHGGGVSSPRSEIEAAEIRLRYQRLLQYTSAGVVTATQDGTVIQCNDIAAQMFGYANAAEALAQTGENRFHIYAFEGALHDRLMKDGKVENIEWTFLGRNGKLLRIQEYATLLESSVGDTPVVERILTDISKTHKLGEEIRHIRKMESAKDLAAATIRSFKDLCASLVKSCELMIATAGDGKEVQRLAGSIRNDANTGIKYANQFLAVSQKADKAPALLNVNEIMVSSDVMLKNLIGEDINLQTTLDPNVGWISADSSDVIQLIGNFLANARETLPLGGTINIETSNVEIDDSGDLPEEIRPGIYVRIVFSTDGCSIHPERRNNSVRTTVDRMGGWVVTDNGLRNTNTVYLPRVEIPTGNTDLMANRIGA